MDHRQVIDLWPSVAELARDLRVSPANVYKWHERRSIPARCWMDLVWAAQSREIPLDVEDLAKAARESAA